MQAFNQTSKYFNIENFELLKSKIFEFTTKARKTFAIQLLNFFLNQGFKYIQTDEFKILSLVVCITLLFNITFWYFLSSSRRVKKLEEVIENLKSENDKEVVIDEVTKILLKKMEERIDDIEIHALEEMEDLLERTEIALENNSDSAKDNMSLQNNMESTKNNIEILFEDVENLNNSISNIKKVSTTIAYIDGKNQIDEECILESLQYRHAP